MMINKKVKYKLYVIKNKDEKHIKIILIKIYN